MINEPCLYLSFTFGVICFLFGVGAGSKEQGAGRGESGQEGGAQKWLGKESSWNN